MSHSSTGPESSRKPRSRETVPAGPEGCPWRPTQVRAALRSFHCVSAFVSCVQKHPEEVACPRSGPSTKKNPRVNNTAHHHPSASPEKGAPKAAVGVSPSPEQAGPFQPGWGSQPEPPAALGTTEMGTNTSTASSRSPDAE